MNNTTCTTTISTFVTSNIDAKTFTETMCLLALILIGIECVVVQLKFTKSKVINNLATTLNYQWKYYRSSFRADDISCTLFALAILHHDVITNSCQDVIPKYKYVDVMATIFFALIIVVPAVAASFKPLKFIYDHFHLALTILITILSVSMYDVHTSVEAAMHLIGKEKEKNITGIIEVAIKGLGFSNKDHWFVCWFVYLSLIDVFIVCCCQTLGKDNVKEVCLQDCVAKESCPSDIVATGRLKEDNFLDTKYEARLEEVARLTEMKRLKAIEILRFTDTTKRDQKRLKEKKQFINSLSIRTDTNDVIKKLTTKHFTKNRPKQLRKRRNTLTSITTSPLTIRRKARRGEKVELRSQSTCY